MVYRDGSGRVLEDYPRPSVAADTAVLTIDHSRLSVVLVPEVVTADPLVWSLPGTFVHPGERLADAARRALSEKARIADADPRQLHVFDEPDRDDRGWVMSVAHFDVRRRETLGTTDKRWVVPIDDLPALRYDHARIIGYAVDVVRREYLVAPDPFGLLAPPFTMRQLRALHEIVLDRGILPDTFRRTMQPLLSATGKVFSEGRGRPAELYRRA